MKLARCLGTASLTKILSNFSILAPNNRMRLKHKTYHNRGVAVIYSDTYSAGDGWMRLAALADDSEG